MSGGLRKNKMLYKNISIFVIIIIAWIIIISIYILYSSIHPRNYVTEKTPNDIGVDYEDIELKTEDGLKLAAWYIDSKKDSTIILMHGYPMDKSVLLDYIAFLYKKYNIIAFDFRYFGYSEGKHTTVGYEEKKDLKAAISYAREKGAKKIGLFGGSMGAAVAIMTASETKVDAIVADSPYSNLYEMIKKRYEQFYFMKYPFVWITELIAKPLMKTSLRDVSPLNHVKKLDIPIFLIICYKDDTVSVEGVKKMAESSNTELWVIKAQGHVTGHYFFPEEYEKRVLEFYEKNLK